jgi:hypothetical protein
LEVGGEMGVSEPLSKVPVDTGREREGERKGERKEETILSPIKSALLPILSSLSPPTFLAPRSPHHVVFKSLSSIALHFLEMESDTAREIAKIDFLGNASNGYMDSFCTRNWV